ncbi:MAG: host attachment protein [Gammaproteobacteria bacterium]
MTKEEGGSMAQYCVVVSNGTRARFFTLQPAQVPELESGPNLIEHNALVNTEREAASNELWSENKTGRNRAPKGGPAHGYDDHRSRHQDEYERRFASSIAEECCRLSDRHRPSDVVLVAQKRMLGFLRNAMESRLNGVATHEIPKDLSKLTPRELHEHLARTSILPRRKSPAA